MATISHRDRPRTTYVDRLAALSDFIPHWLPTFCKIGTLTVVAATVSGWCGYYRGASAERAKAAAIAEALQQQRIARGYFRTDEVAAELGKSERTVQLWCQTGKIAGAFKVGKEWRIPIDYQVGGEG